MTITNNVTRMLAQRKIAFEAHELPAEKLGALGTADLLGVPPEQVFKTIVSLRASGGKPVLAVVPGPATVSLKLLGRALDAKMKLATQDQAEEMTGLQTGGISPLALIGKGFDVVLDESAMGFDKIHLSGGQRGLNISISPKDVVALTRAKIANVSDEG